MEGIEAGGLSYLENISPPQGMLPGLQRLSPKLQLLSLLEEGIPKITRDRRANYEKAALWKQRLTLSAKELRSYNTHYYYFTNPALTEDETATFGEWTDEMLGEVEAIVKRVEEADSFLEKLHQLVQELRESPELVIAPSNDIPSPNT